MTMYFILLLRKETHFPEEAILFSVGKEEKTKLLMKIGIKPIRLFERTCILGL